MVPPKHHNKHQPNCRRPAAERDIVGLPPDQETRAASENSCTAITKHFPAPFLPCMFMTLSCSLRYRSLSRVPVLTTSPSTSFSSPP